MNVVTPKTQDQLDKITNSLGTYFRQFTQVHSSHKYEYIVCIEGNDQPYYSSICQQYLNTDKIYFLRCDGKNNVLDLIQTLHSHTDVKYKNAACFGIVDKDYGLDKIFSTDRIYETPTYSFENFYLSKSCFTKIIEQYFHLKEFNHFNEDFAKVTKNYEQRLNEFIQIIIDVDKKYRATQISQKKLQEKLPKYSVDNITLSHTTVLINLEEIRLIGNIFTADKDIEHSYTEHSLAESAQHYNHSDIWKYTRNIRGKFFLIFLFNYLTELKKDIETSDLRSKIIDRKSPVCCLQRRALRDNPLFNKKLLYKIQVQFNMENLLSVFATCADIPECLKIFLKTQSYKFKPTN